MFQNVLPSSPEMKNYVHEFVRELIAHEIGHTLGLRHNFHGSAMLKPEDLNTHHDYSKRRTRRLRDGLQSC